MRVVIAGGHGKIALLLERLLAERGDQAVGLIRNPAHFADVPKLPPAAPGRRAGIKSSWRRWPHDIPGYSLVGVGQGRMFMQHRISFDYPLLPLVVAVCGQLAERT
jgi:hypothetical protein